MLSVMLSFVLFSSVFSYLEKYEKGFIVHADNVGSMQFQNIRKVNSGFICCYPPYLLINMIAFH